MARSLARHSTTSLVVSRNCNGDLCCFNVSAKEDPSAIPVFCSKGRKLRITRSWNFLGLEKNGEVPAHSLWKKPRFGQDIIIGNLENDTSFSHFLLNSSTGVC